MPLATFQNKTKSEITFGVFGRRDTSHFHIRIAAGHPPETPSEEFTNGYAYCFAVWLDQDDGKLYPDNGHAYLTGHKVTSSHITVTLTESGLTVVDNV